MRKKNGLFSVLFAGQFKRERYADIRSVIIRLNSKIYLLFFTPLNQSLESG